LILDCMRKKYNNYLGRCFNKRRTSDKLSLAQRSELMSNIRSKKTNFEIAFVKQLRKATKRRFLVNVSSMKGKPDIVFNNSRICVFLDSDFWHGWQYPRWKHLLKNNFWRNKIENNRNRDKRTAAYLKRHGWKVIRVWEHNINNNLIKAIRDILCLAK